MMTSGSLPINPTSGSLPVSAPRNNAGGIPLRPRTIPTQSAPPSAKIDYERVGGLTSHDLLYGKHNQFEHLDDRILQVRNWVQEYFKNHNRSEDIALARKDKEKRAEMEVELDRALLQYMSASSNMPRGNDRNIIIASVINEILGLGPIEPLWQDPKITEVMVNGPDDVYVEIKGKLVGVPGCRFRDKDHLLDVCSQILAPLNRRVDQKTPLTDGRLTDGSRVNVAHYSVAPGGPLLTIRRHPETVWTMVDLVERNSITAEMATVLAWLVYHKCSAIVLGGTGSGKTSLLNALSSCIPRDERIITIEDSMELRLHPSAHVAAMEARPASASGEGAVPIRSLVVNALRMRPDRIIVGECRDGAALDMLTAMNTGHEGSMTTIHSNDAEAAVSRLSTLVAMGGEIPDDKVSWLVSEAVDLFVVQRRYEDGSRRVAGIYEIPSLADSSNGRLVPIPLWEWEQDGTDANGNFTGHYVKKNDISENLVRSRRLDKFEPFTYDDVIRLSELPEHLKKSSH